MPALRYRILCRSSWNPEPFRYHTDRDRRCRAAHRAWHRPGVSRRRYFRLRNNAGRVRVLVAPRPVDLRPGAHGLATMVQLFLQQDPFSNNERVHCTIRQPAAAGQTLLGPPIALPRCRPWWTPCGHQRRSRSLASIGELMQLIEISSEIGAGEGIRTPDPNLGKVVLYP